jgi:hypothetical protein
MKELNNIILYFFYLIVLIIILIMVKEFPSFDKKNLIKSLNKL